MSTGTATFKDVATGLTASASANFTVTTATRPLILTGQNIHLLNQSDPVTAAKWFNTPASFARGSDPTASPVQDGFLTTPVLAYTSYAQLQSDLMAGKITYPYKWLYYDPEDWNLTPQQEIDNPWFYMGQFGILGHQHGYSVAISPGKDLGNDPTSKQPKKPGETNDQWYVRTNLAGAAAVDGDLVVVQGQGDTTNLTAYDTLFNGAKAGAVAANPAVKVFCHVSTSFGTPAQMAAAVHSVTSDGIYINASSATIPAVSTFLADL